MNGKRELGVKLSMVSMFIISFMFSVLWLTGLMDVESSTPIGQDTSEGKKMKPPGKEPLAPFFQPEYSPEIKKGTDDVDETSEYKHKQALATDPDHKRIQQMLNERDQETATENVLYLESNDQTKQEYKREVKLKAASVENDEPPEEDIPLTFDIEYDLHALENELDLSQFPVMEVLATGYTAGYESTGKRPDNPEYGITYSGVKVRRDLYSTIAADTQVFPLGTVLYIPGYGYGVVADIGGAIKGKKIDLYFETVDDVYRLWGKREVEVYVIQEGDGSVSEAVLDQMNQNEAMRVYKPKNK